MKVGEEKRCVSCSLMVHRVCTWDFQPRTELLEKEGEKGGQKTPVIFEVNLEDAALK